MITAIPNQPIGFDATRVAGCYVEDPYETLLIHTDDDLSFQVGYEPCIGPNLVTYPGFENSAGFDSYSMNIATENACKNGMLPGTFIRDITAVPVIGSTYRVELTVTSITTPTSLASLTVSFGGVFLDNIRATGSYFWTVTAVTNETLRVASRTIDMRFCLSFMGVYLADTLLRVDILNLDDEVVVSYPYNTVYYPAYEDLYTFGTNTVTFTVPAEDPAITGCHRVRITDECDDSVLTSQVLAFGAHECTLKIEACNVSDGIGFEGFRPLMRIKGKINRPTYEYESSQERLSDGTLNRPFAQRFMKLELRADNVGEYGHRFLSTLPLYDHVYIDGEEYVAKADAYEPAYNDVYDATASIIIPIEPKVDLARKVRAVEDGGGCTPPNPPGSSRSMLMGTPFGAGNSYGLLVPADTTNWLNPATQTQWTVSYRFRLVTNNALYSVLPKYYQLYLAVATPSTRWQVFLGVDPASGDIFISRSGTAWSAGAYTCAAPVDDGEWHVVTFVRNGASYDDWSINSGIKVYFDGVLQTLVLASGSFASYTAANIDTPTVTAYFVQYLGGGTNNNHALIDETYTWDTARTASNVANIIAPNDIVGNDTLWQRRHAHRIESTDTNTSVADLSGGVALIAPGGLYTNSLSLDVDPNI
jgi:hypothetical protein